MMGNAILQLTRLLMDDCWHAKITGANTIVQLAEYSEFGIVLIVSVTHSVFKLNFVI